MTRSCPVTWYRVLSYEMCIAFGVVPLSNMYIVSPPTEEPQKPNRGRSVPIRNSRLCGFVAQFHTLHTYTVVAASKFHPSGLYYINNRFKANRRRKKSKNCLQSFRQVTFTMLMKMMVFFHEVLFPRSIKYISVQL